MSGRRTLVYCFSFQLTLSIFERRRQTLRQKCPTFSFLSAATASPNGLLPPNDHLLPPNDGLLPPYYRLLPPNEIDIKPENEKTPLSSATTASCYRAGGGWPPPKRGEGKKGEKKKGGGGLRRQHLPADMGFIIMMRPAK